MIWKWLASFIENSRHTTAKCFLIDETAHMHSEHAIECGIINCEKTDKIRISVLKSSLEERERLRENFNKKWIWEEETKNKTLKRQLLYTGSITSDKIHCISLFLLLLFCELLFSSKTILIQSLGNILGLTDFTNQHWKYYDLVVNKYINSLENISAWHWLNGLNCLCIWKKKLSKMAVKNINNASW